MIIIVKVFIIVVLKSALITSIVDHNKKQVSDYSHDEKGLSYYEGFWHINRCSEEYGNCEKGIVHKWGFKYVLNKKGLFFIMSVFDT